MVFGELVSPFSMADGLRGGAAMLAMKNDNPQRSDQARAYEEANVRGRRVWQRRVEKAGVSHLEVRLEEALASNRKPYMAD